MPTKLAILFEGKVIPRPKVSQKLLFKGEY